MNRECRQHLTLIEGTLYQDLNHLAVCLQVIHLAKLGSASP
jgi:hypothetical protein